MEPDLKEILADLYASNPDAYNEYCFFWKQLINNTKTPDVRELIYSMYIKALPTKV